MVVVREYTPNSPGSRASSTRATLTLTFSHWDLSLGDARELCGGTSLPQIRKKTAREGLGQSGPTPRQRRHHRRRRPPYYSSHSIPPKPLLQYTTHTSKCFQTYLIQSTDILYPTIIGENQLPTPLWNPWHYEFPPCSDPPHILYIGTYPFRGLRGARSPAIAGDRAKPPCMIRRFGFVSAAAAACKPECNALSGGGADAEPEAP